MPLLRRRRGDSADVSATLPDGAAVAGLRRWVREWLAREGRQVPRTAREQAIAATGSAERGMVQAHPAPDGRPHWIPNQLGSSEQPAVLREDQLAPRDLIVRHQPY
ncbi:MAG: hypothetical protein ACRDPY_23390 [Streptosporangiaceae bacterium]